MAWRRGQAYGQALRDCVLACRDMTLVEVATRFGVSPSYVSKARARLRDLGDPAPGQQRCHVPLRSADLIEELKSQIHRYPDSTLNELRLWLSQTYRVSVRYSVMWKVVARLGLIYKKHLQAEEQRREDIAEARREWSVRQPTLDPERLVFLDETWATTNMTRTRGRAPRGKRLVGTVPHGHWYTTTSLAGLRTSGFVAPLVLDGAINGETFLAYTQQFLAKELKPGDIVVPDNLSSHKVTGIREAIEAVGASLVYLPPYSPDLNPIELTFSKFKRLLRDAAERTVEDLWNTIGRTLQRFTPNECTNYGRHCGFSYAAR
ncbi:MAG: IS630 family transposase [Acidocella sp.]|nr:IS630 family transposase [Acidocella sp.]